MTHVEGLYRSNKDEAIRKNTEFHHLLLKQYSSKQANPTKNVMSYPPCLLGESKIPMLQSLSLFNVKIRGHDENQPVFTSNPQRNPN